MPAQLPIPDYTTFKPQVAWSTIIQNVQMLSAYLYNITVVADNTNDLGSGTKEVGFFIRDFVGTDFRVTGISVGGNSDIIEVEDILKIGYGPQSGQPAVVYKSVGDGTAPIIGPIRMDLLDKSARDAADAIEKASSWEGQKPIEVPFTNLATPSILNYYRDYFTRFTNNPTVELFSEIDGKIVPRMEKPSELNYVSKTVNGVTSDYLDEIIYDLAESCSGYIKLSR